MTRHTGIFVENVSPPVVHENLASARIVLSALIVAARPKPEARGKTGLPQLGKFPSRLGPALRRPKDALRLRDGGESLDDCGRERRRGSADQGRELAAVVEQRPVRRVAIPTGDGFCERLG